MIRKNSCKQVWREDQLVSHPEPDLRVWYPVQVDYLMSRLTSLEGRIGGTEDQLNIEMDHRYTFPREKGLDMCLKSTSTIM